MLKTCKVMRNEIHNEAINYFMEQENIKSICITDSRN